MSWLEHPQRARPLRTLAGRNGLDEGRGVCVLHGGSSGAVYLSDTWEWDGVAWTHRSDAGPIRRLHDMAYDSRRGVTVLYAGQLYNGASGSDTWEWDGATWSMRAVLEPGLRREHAMAYDAARGVTVMFGGIRNGVYQNDTWVWDGTVWTQKSVASPPAPRRGHRMVYDPARGVVVMVGGVASGNQLLESAPRSYACMAYDSARDAVVLHGGERYSLAPARRVGAGRRRDARLLDAGSALHDLPSGWRLADACGRRRERWPIRVSVAQGRHSDRRCDGHDAHPQRAHRAGRGPV